MVALLLGSYLGHVTEHVRMEPNVVVGDVQMALQQDVGHQSTGDAWRSNKERSEVRQHSQLGEHSRTVQISSGRSLKCLRNFFWRVLSWAAGWEVSESESSSAWEVGTIPDWPLPPEQPVLSDLSVPQTQTVKECSGLGWSYLRWLFSFWWRSVSHHFPPRQRLPLTWLREIRNYFPVSWDRLRDRDILSVVCSVERQSWGPFYIVTQV